MVLRRRAGLSRRTAAAMIAASLGTAGALVVVAAGPAAAALPVAVDDAYSTPVDTPLFVTGPGPLSNDTDPDGDTLTWGYITDPANGTLSGTSFDGTFTYTPDPGFSGVDSFLYSAYDGTSAGNIATITITVAGTPVPSPSIDLSVTVMLDTGVDTCATTVSVVDVIPGSTVRYCYTVFNNGNVGLAVHTASDSVLGDLLAGEPDPGLLAPLDTYSFTRTQVVTATMVNEVSWVARDAVPVAYFATDTDAVSVELVPAPSDVPPVAVGDTFSTAVGVPLVVAAPGVLANDTDPEGAPLTWIVLTGPAHGTLVSTPDGAFTYTPDPGFVGTETLTYVAHDSTGPGNVATLTITVADPPTTPPGGTGAPTVVPVSSATAGGGTAPTALAASGWPGLPLVVVALGSVLAGLVTTAATRRRVGDAGRATTPR
jgi:hypothetical protein